MKIIIAAFMLVFLMSCSSIQKTEGLTTGDVLEIDGTYNKMYRDVPPANYSKYNDRDNVGEFFDDGYYKWEKFAHSIEYYETNVLDLIFYPFKKNELRQGMTLIYR